jgi:hypothetical protein
MLARDLEILFEALQQTKANYLRREVNTVSKHYS